MQANHVKWLWSEKIMLLLIHFQIVVLFPLEMHLLSKHTVDQLFRDF